MKSFLLFLAACAAGVSIVRGDLTLVQSIEGPGPKIENTALFKDGKTRVDASPGTSIIMEGRSGDMISLAHREKTYLKVSGETARAAVQKMKEEQGSQPDTKPQLNATGKKETISGYAAEEYTCTVAGVKMALWLTTALPGYQAALKEMAAALASGPLATMMQSYGVDLAALPGFPLRTVLEPQPGQTITRTVLSVSTQPVPDSAFEIPAGYKEVVVSTLTPPAAKSAPEKK